MDNIVSLAVLSIIGLSGLFFLVWLLLRHNEILAEILRQLREGIYFRKE